MKYCLRSNYLLKTKLCSPEQKLYYWSSEFCRNISESVHTKFKY